MPRRERPGRLAMTAVAVVAITVSSLCSPAVAAPRVRCHVDYGGEVRHIEARPVASPLAVAPIEVGSYFRFRLVLLRASGLPDEVRIEIHNRGRLADDFRLDHRPATVSGLGLVRALLPRRSARLSVSPQDGAVVATLHLSPPVVRLDDLAP